MLSGGGRNFPVRAEFIRGMNKWANLVQISVLCAGLGGGCLPAQEPMQMQGNSGPAQTDPSVYANLSPVPLEWVPPALLELQAQAAVKSSFTLDRAMLGAAASLMPDSDADVKQAVNKLDGVSVHLLRFGADGIADEAAVNAVRDAYHLRGWKHLVTTTDNGGPIHNGKTDVWVVMDGINIRGAVVLAETPKSLTLVTVAGNLSPVDLLHLRGHFGIPQFDGDGLSPHRDRDKR